MLAFITLAFIIYLTSEACNYFDILRIQRFTTHKVKLQEKKNNFHKSFTALIDHPGSWVPGCST